MGQRTCIVKDCGNLISTEHNVAGISISACDEHSDKITVLLLEYYHDDLRLQQTVFFTIRNLGHREGGE